MTPCLDAPPLSGFLLSLRSSVRVDLKMNELFVFVVLQTVRL